MNQLKKVLIIAAGVLLVFFGLFIAVTSLVLMYGLGSKLYYAAIGLIVVGAGWSVIRLVEKNILRAVTYLFWPFGF